MQAATQIEPQPHQHHCAAHPPIHQPGRESPANMVKGEFVGGYDPKACLCANPDAPQCCASHPTADPNYKPRSAFNLNQLQGFAEEIRKLKAETEDLPNLREDVRELKAQVATLTAQVTKLGSMRVV